MNPLLHWPWEQGKDPYFVNDKNNEWYVDEYTTNCALKNGLDDMAAFIVKFQSGDIERVLIDNKQQVWIVTKSLEDMLHFIDALRISRLKQNPLS